ncbi:acetate kinase [Desulfocicer vacuolatum DSM 3385]|uniref:Acetate kinase n=1 Tax=Desulfocicer vacuolatum DSM 3385 TaxID=1121400 RepID=A0A1W2CFI2_9BACT|nr:acetate kinase [Desulfocicer vacuolatum]SMC83909.1 acetate kinase [Desulfocicer vacuolatum DSM 3385]
MIVLVINAGSSSLKYQLLNMQENKVMAGGVVERIGDTLGVVTHKKLTGAAPEKFVREEKIADHRDAMHLVADLIIDEHAGVIKNKDEINAIGHRVVQGGEDFRAATVIDADIKKSIEKNNPLAPLHNPPNLMGIDVAEALFPGIINIAVFDTEFHQTMPAKAFLYALPYEFYEKMRVRRYGFHGTSHKYVARAAAVHMDKPVDELNLITVHLGNGCSISAVEKGRCIDTSMGMTPLAGVMMGTRTGDIDPAIQRYVMENTGMGVDEMDTLFNKKSGLKGICGMNDMRDIHDAGENGNQRAKLAVDMFTYQVKKYIGAYMAALGRVDGIIFTAGIGENDDIVRAGVCADLSGLGMELDLEKNRGRISEPKALHTPESRVQIWVIPTNEELQIAQEVVDILQAQKK